MLKYYKVSEKELVKLLAASLELAMVDPHIEDFSDYMTSQAIDIQEWAKELGMPLIKHKAYFYEDIAREMIKQSKEYELIS